jgi:hypothetical protein
MLSVDKPQLARRSRPKDTALNTTKWNESLVALYREVARGLARLEAQGAALGIQPPAGPMPQPKGRRLDELVRAARLLDRRFQAWNERVLEAERHLEAPTSESLGARQVGILAHRWYEATKPLYGELGVVRHHAATVALYKRALIEADHNEHAKRFLADRGMDERRVTS